MRPRGCTRCAMVWNWIDSGWNKTKQNNNSAVNRSTNGNANVWSCNSKSSSGSTNWKPNGRHLLCALVGGRKSVISSNKHCSATRIQLEQRQATLERVRAEMLRLHREALEMRLVAEQLWAQLAGRATPAELTAGVSKLHSQLADEFRFASQELETQRHSLRELIGRLEQKQQELTEQRNELVEWFRRRQADLAHKAVELSQRDQQLNTERQKFRDQQQQWKSERRRLQQQIHQLEALQLHRGNHVELAAGAAN